MGLPTVFANAPGLFPTIPTGIVVGLIPSSDAAFSIELQRSVGSTASTNFSTLTKVDPVQSFESGQRIVTGYTDGAAPDDNITRYYRARHFANGYTAGPWSRVVGAKPAPLTGVNLNGRNVIKELVVPFSAFVKGVTSTAPGGGQIVHDFTNGYFYNSNTAGTPTDRRDAYAPIVVPKGARIDRFSFVRSFSSGSGVDAEAYFYKTTTTGITTIADITSTGTYGWATLSTSAVLTYTTSMSLSAYVVLRATATTGVAVRAVSIRYRDPIGLGGDGRGRY